MRERVELKENWRIKQGFGKEGTWISVEIFAQIQDILFEHQMLPEKISGRMIPEKDALFIGKNDWSYESDLRHVQKNHW